MARSPLSVLAFVGAFLSYSLYTYGPQVHRTLTVIGALRQHPASTQGLEEVIVIPDTIHCEDLHYYSPANVIFTACEDKLETRFGWFPGLANLDDPELGRRGRGSIHVIDVDYQGNQQTTDEEIPTPLLENFDTTFVTHGIDVVPDLADPSAIYVFAINHLPHPTLPHQARSQIEVFHHVLGSLSARHLRSLWGPLIRTPNDVLGTAPDTLYVTNDHRHAHGLKRTLEDLYRGATWTDTVRLQFSPSPPTTDSSADITASVALDRMHNNNGIGHGRTPDEVLITSCTAGVLHIGRLSANGSIALSESVEFDSIVDNPSYFADPYARSSGVDHSGFLLPGLARAVDLRHTKTDPNATNSVVVWFARLKTEGGRRRWEKRALFEDDGSRIRSASAAVLVAIDPARTGGVRKAWLFVTGFQSEGMVAVKVDM